MFTSARIKLTAWYLVIIMAVSLVFSLMVYNILMREVNRFAQAQRIRIENRWGPFGNPVPTIVVPDPDLIDEIRRRIVLTLVLIDSGILVISGGLGYFLAGRTLKPIQNMVDEQNRFISDASHELKTPLTSLKVGMEVFLRDKRPKLGDAKAVISESMSEISRLQSLSESLLQLTQYQKTNSQIKFSRILSSVFIAAAVKKLEPLAAAKKIAISFPREDFLINGNLYSLTDLLVILLDNAIKYSDNNTKIKVNAFSSEDKLFIKVQDEGYGIPKEHFPRLFERFYRIDKSRSRDEGGTGLGLAIVKHIAQVHKGTVEVESEPGKGSTFTIILPII